MDNSKISDLVKGAVKVNLQYSASLLDLSKDYIKSMGVALATSASGTAQPDTTKDRDQSDTSNKSSARIPLIIAGRTGETANATFAVHNTSGVKGTVTMQYDGDFPGVTLEIEPPEITLDVGGSELVRILAKFSNKAEINKDMSGFVFIPELGVRVAEFVMKRLPDKPKKTKPSPAKKTTKTDGK